MCEPIRLNQLYPVLVMARTDNRPLVEPTIESTSQKVQQLVKSLSQGERIDSMTERWLSLTPNPPRTTVSYTLTKIDKPTLDLLLSGC